MRLELVEMDRAGPHFNSEGLLFDSKSGDDSTMLTMCCSML